MAENDEPEIEYYRTIEDLFAALRGVPHILSPKDFELMRGWWRDEIPLSAVRTGITEVFARRSERDDPSPLVSLSYCRHAVQTHAKRIAAMQVGAATDTPPTLDADAALRSLAQRLGDASKKQQSSRPRVAAAIDRLAAEVLSATELPPHLVEEHLYALETTLLANCLVALDDEERAGLEERARQEAAASTADDEARERSFRALRDRSLRTLLELPRLEIDW